MTMPRSLLVDLSVTRFYHCISRCVRQASLVSEGRKQWLEDRLELLVACFAVSVCGFSVMDNHLHVLTRLDPDNEPDWSDEEVARRWLTIYPPKDSKRKPIELTDKYIRRYIKQRKKVREYRKRLVSLSWFMKALKEPLSRLANKEDGCKGAFWDARFKSIAILDEQSLMATCAYIDLNPVAAGIAALPETSSHTSLCERLKHLKRNGGLGRLQAIRGGHAAASQAAGDLEQQHWLCPIQDRSPQGAARTGMLTGITLASYLLLVDHTSRLHRDGKAYVRKEVPEILDRLRTDCASWQRWMNQLFNRNWEYGTYFGGNRKQMQLLAERLGVRRLINLNGCQAN